MQEHHIEGEGESRTYHPLAMQKITKWTRWLTDNGRTSPTVATVKSSTAPLSRVPDREHSSATPPRKKFDQFKLQYEFCMINGIPIDLNKRETRVAMVYDKADSCDEYVLKLQLVHCEHQRFDMPQRPLEYVAYPYPIYEVPKEVSQIFINAAYEGVGKRNNEAFNAHIRGLSTPVVESTTLETRIGDSTGWRSWCLLSQKQVKTLFSMLEDFYNPPNKQS